MTDRSKPRHELCIDKTSCKAELESKNPAQTNARTSAGLSGPVGHLTKDSIKDQYLQSQKQNNTIK